MGHAINNISTPAFLSLGIPAVAQLGALNAVIYGFHMPLFFFIAGIFADKSLRYPVGAFLKKRLIRYAVPYFAWTAIVVFIKVCTPGLQNTQAGIQELFLSPIVPFEEYWFLYVLFFISVTYYFAMKAGKPRNVKFALLAVSAALRVLSPFLPNVWIIPSFSNSAFYFMLGSHFDYVRLPEKLMGKRFMPPLLAGGFASFNAIYILSGLYQSKGFIKSWYSVALALMGIALTIGLAYRLSTADTAFTRMLTFCGFNSMQIYCSHQVPMGVIRLFLHRLMGVNCLWARTLIQTCATMAVCCVAFHCWPNDPYLHLALFGEPKIKKKAIQDKKDASSS